MTTPVAFPWPHEPTEAFIWTQRWNTEILTAYNGEEQRIGRRTFAASAIRFTVRRVDALADVGVVREVWAHRGDQWAVPLWPYAARTSAALYGGEVTVPCSPPAPGCGLDILPWKVSDRQAKAWFMVWDSPSRWTILEMNGLQRSNGWATEWASSWGLAPELTPLSPLLLEVCVPGGVSWDFAWNLSWGAKTNTDPVFRTGSLVVPCRVGRLDASLSGSVDALEVADGTYSWVVEEGAE